MSQATTKKIDDFTVNVEHAERIFTEHGDFVRSILRFHVRNVVEREDLFQDFFLWLILKPIPRDVQNVKGYIYQVISDNVKDAMRRIERYQRRLCRYADHCGRVTENRPENSLIEMEESEKMFELIRRHLPRKEALAITLKYKNNYDIAETAEKMDIKSKSVSRYISAGTKKLRQVLSTDDRSSHDS